VTKQPFKHILREFKWPNLNDKNHSVTSPKDHRYNCIAWALGINDKWIWPDTNDSLWVEGISPEDELEALTQMFLKVGYEKCNNWDFERGYQKVVIYVDRKGPTHAARQVESGEWVSKMGDLEDIEHDTVKVLEGNGFGTAKVFLKRKSS
jgi:hypothetical protein